MMSGIGRVGYPVVSLFKSDPTPVVINKKYDKYVIWGCKGGGQNAIVPIGNRLAEILLYLEISD